MKEKTLKQVKELSEDTIDNFNELERAIEATYKVVDSKINAIVQKVNVMKDEENTITIEQWDNVKCLYKRVICNSHEHRLLL